MKTNLLLGRRSTVLSFLVLAASTVNFFLAYNLYEQSPLLGKLFIANGLILISVFGALRYSLFQLAASEERYRAFVVNSAEGVYRLEFVPPIDTSLPFQQLIHAVYKNGRFAECNDTFARMYGFDQAVELVGRDLSLMLPPDDEGVQAYLKSIMDAGFRVIDAESEERDKNGNLVHFANSLFGVLEDGKLIRIWGTQRDISAQKQAESELKEADRKKDEFLATLAHELRNPLAPVRNGLQILKLAAPRDDSTTKAREIMERQLSHMVRLIDDLLDISRVSRGKVELRKDEVTLKQVIDAALETGRHYIEDAKHKLTVKLPEKSLWLDADITRLAQIFSNILTNAAKYTPAGGTIEIEATEEIGYVVVKIRDNGIGIAPEMLGKVFEMFTQINRGSEQTSGGLGIGLSLVKRLVEMHEGTISAESPGRGGGSTFTVRLPLIYPTIEQQARYIAVKNFDGHAGSIAHRIMVVDDNVDGAESLASMLQLSGHTTKTAHNGEEALEVVDEFSPDIIFLDIGMPGMDGYEVAKQLRQNHARTEMTLIALTGWGTESDKDQAKEAGFDYHLTKPVEAAAVDKVLARI